MNRNRRMIDMAAGVKRGKVQPEPRSRDRFDDHNVKEPVVALGTRSHFHSRSAKATIRCENQSHGTRVNFAVVDTNYNIGPRMSGDSRKTPQGKSQTRPEVLRAAVNRLDDEATESEAGLVEEVAGLLSTLAAHMNNAASVHSPATTGRQKLDRLFGGQRHPQGTGKVTTRAQGQDPDLSLIA